MRASKTTLSFVAALVVILLCVAVGFPRHGNKVIDFRGRMTITTAVQYFGIATEQYALFT